MFGGNHEHLFYAHQDPRWLLCDCGQYAVRTRTSHGQASVRLIDPPQPAFRHLSASDLCTDLRAGELASSGTTATLQRQSA